MRFAHMVDGFDRLKGIMRTVYNQYDSMERPLHKWLDARGVNFELNTRVTDLSFNEENGTTAVTHIVFEQSGKPGKIEVRANDYVLVTLGSMTEASSTGTMDSAPRCTAKSMAEPGYSGRKLPRKGPLSETLRFSPIILMSRNGFHSP
jgi:oleate hydratase